MMEEPFSFNTNPPTTRSFSESAALQQSGKTVDTETSDERFVIEAIRAFFAEDLAELSERLADRAREGAKRQKRDRSVVFSILALYFCFVGGVIATSGTPPGVIPLALGVLASVITAVALTRYALTRSKG